MFSGTTHTALSRRLKKDVTQACLWTLCALMLLSLPALAQAPPASTNPTPTTPAPASTEPTPTPTTPAPAPAATTPAPATPPSVPTPEPEKAGVPKPAADLLKYLDYFPYVIVVPQENDIRRLEQGSIIIPADSLEKWRENELTNRNRTQERSTITSADFTIDLDGDPAKGKARLDLRVDGPQGASIPIGMREAILTKAEIRELVPAPADLGGVKPSEGWIPSIRSGAAGYEIRVDKPGNYQFDVEFLLDVTRMPLDRSIRLTPPPATIPRARFTSKAPLVLLRNLSTTQDIPLSEDRHSAQIALAAGQSLSVMWRNANDAVPRSLIASAESLIQVRIEDRFIETDTTMDLDAPEDIPECSFVLPAVEQSLQVIPTRNEEAIPHDLTLSTEGDQRRATVRFARSISGRFKIRVISRRTYTIDEGPLEVGRISVDGAEQQGGTILLSWAPNLWVRAKLGRHTQKKNLSELPREAQLLQPRQAYRATAAFSSVVVTVEPARPVLSATAASDLTIGAESAFLTTRFVFSVRGAQADSFSIRVPAGMRNLEASPVNVVRLVDGNTSADGRTRLVQATLAEPVEDTEFQMTVRGEIPIQTDGINRIDLPTLDPDRFVHGTLTVRVGPGVRPILNDAGTEFLRREPIPEEEIIEPAAYWFFRIQPGPARLSFQIEPLPARIEASVESEFMRTGKDIEARTFLRFRARHSPFDEVTISIPAAAKDIRMSGDLLEEGSVVEPGTKSLRLRNPASSCELRVDYHLPLTDAQTHEIELPLVMPRGVSIEGWKGRVFCDRGLRAVASGAWISSRPAPSPVVVSGQQPVLDIRPTSLDAIPETLSLRFEPTAMLATLVAPRLLIEEVFTADGGRWGRKRWLISKHRARDVSIKVPLHARIREVFVDGHPTDSVADGNRIIFVRLPAVDAPCTLEVDYFFPEAQPDGAFAIRELESPQLMEDIAVEQVRWIFHVVEDRLMLGLGSAPAEKITWEPSWLASGLTNKTSNDRKGVEWLEQANGDVHWATDSIVSSGGRVWQFDAFNRDNSVRLVVLLIREPFWVLICSGTFLVLLLAAARLKPRTQLRLAVAVILIVVGILAVMPELLSWLWLGGRWGLALGLAAVIWQYLVRYRRQRAYSVGLRRFNSRQMGLGSSILRRLDPKTRISSGAAVKR